MVNATVMVVDGGARGHVLSEAYERSPNVSRIIVAPGNDFVGYRRQKEVIIKKCDLKKPETILALANEYKPDLIDVAQDDALAAGTVDLLQQNGFIVFGPTREAARIEWDKQWSRNFMKKYGIPAPGFMSFSEELEAIEYVTGLYSKNTGTILYTKASGLAQGKGALKSTTLEQAIANIRRMKEFKDAGKIFVVEEGLVGEEFSYYAISDGTNFYCFKSSQDNKLALPFDQGEQTGGMGAVCPALVTKGLEREIEENLIGKAINGMQEEGNPFKGILYLGGIVVEGKPVNIEYNARWGDPEGQAVLPGLGTDYFDLVMACVQGRLGEMPIRQDDKTRVCIVGSSRGYPRDYSQVKGKRIFGLEQAMKTDGVKVYGAGIKIEDGKFYANGGRLFSIVGVGNNVRDARQKALAAMAYIHIEGNNLHYRPDIGWRDAQRELGLAAKF